jgi:hypothetical protein
MQNNQLPTKKVRSISSLNNHLSIEEQHTRTIKGTAHWRSDVEERFKLRLLMLMCPHLPHQEISGDASDLNDVEDMKSTFFS